MIIFKKIAYRAWSLHVNHMNHDVAEVNGSDPLMLPGSFLYEKEPGYEARRVHGTTVTRAPRLVAPSM